MAILNNYVRLPEGRGLGDMTLGAGEWSSELIRATTGMITGMIAGMFTTGKG